MGLGTQLLETAKAGGFTPLEAMQWLDEVQRYARSIHLPKNASPSLAKLVQALQAQASALLEVSSPETFREVLGQWSRRVPVTDVQALPYADLALFYELIGSRADLLVRMSGDIKQDPTKQDRWRDWQEMGVDWEDAQALAATLDRVPILGSAAAVEALQSSPVPSPAEVIETAGLRALAFPPGLSAQAQADLLRAVLQTNQELALATGTQGPVLGLGGRIALDLAKPLDASAYCRFLGLEPAACLSTSPGAAVGPLAHEWMHAYEHVLGRDPSLGAEGKQACERLRSVAAQLKQVEVDPAMLRASGKQMWQDWLEHAALPSVRAHCQHWDWDTFIPTKSTVETLTQIMRKDFPLENQANVPVHARLVVAQWEVMQEFASNPATARQPWVAFANAFDRNLTRWLDKPNPRPHPMHGYFRDKSEELSHGFEDWVATQVRQRGASPVSTDIPEHAGVRYPTYAERPAHDRIWRSACDALRPALEQLVGGATVVVEIPNLATARAARGAKQHPIPLQSGLAQAARGPAAPAGG